MNKISFNNTKHRVCFFTFSLIWWIYAIPFLPPFPFSFPFPPIPSPCPPSPFLPLEVGSIKSSCEVWGNSTVRELPITWSGAELQPKSNLVHFSLKIWHLVATILTILLRINWPNLVLEMREILVMRRVSGRWLQNAWVSHEIRETW